MSDLSNLVRRYSMARFGKPSVELDCYDPDVGATFEFTDLFDLIQDFERWRQESRMSDIDKNSAEEKRHTIFAWLLFLLALVVLAIVIGPCDPAPEPVPASHQGTTTLPLTDLQHLPDLPLESTGECTGATSGTSTGTTR